MAIVEFVVPPETKKGALRPFVGTQYRESVLWITK
jgi:hypothetical protein